VNLRVPFLLARAAIPALVAAGGGVIVNVASEAGLVAVPGQVAYNVSKAGLVMLTRSIAADHAADGVRAVSICPGTTATPLVRNAIAAAADPEAHERRLASSRPANRLGTPEEIAEAIAFAVDPAVRFMTGSELVIDGGYTAI
jgi:NAD(P)-dependent dehydrogenase (short-subunit alcohol dehydrogenase family)